MMRISAYLIIFILIATSFTYAQAGGASGHGGMGRGQGWAMRQLDLSEEQQKELACESTGQGRELHEALLRERAKLNDMIRDKNVSDDTIYAQLEIVDKARTAWDRLRLEKMLKARRVLNEEQMGKLLKLQAGEKKD